MTERMPEPEEFTVSMPEGGWQSDLAGKTAEIEQACIDYLKSRHVKPGLAMHPDTYRHFLPRLFAHHPNLRNWLPLTVRESFSHPRESISFFDLSEVKVE